MPSSEVNKAKEVQKLLHRLLDVANLQAVRESALGVEAFLMEGVRRAGCEFAWALGCECH